MVLNIKKCEKDSRKQVSSRRCHWGEVVVDGSNWPLGPLRIHNLQENHWLKHTISSNVNGNPRKPTWWIYGWTKWTISLWGKMNDQLVPLYDLFFLTGDLRNVSLCGYSSLVYTTFSSWKSKWKHSNFGAASTLLELQVISLGLFFHLRPAITWQFFAPAASTVPTNGPSCIQFGPFSTSGSHSFREKAIENSWGFEWDEVNHPCTKRNYCTGVILHAAFLKVSWKVLIHGGGGYFKMV